MIHPKHYDCLDTMVFRCFQADFQCKFYVRLRYFIFRRSKCFFYLRNRFQSFRHADNMLCVPVYSTALVFNVQMTDAKQYEYFKISPERNIGSTLDPPWVAPLRKLNNLITFFLGNYDINCVVLSHWCHEGSICIAYKSFCCHQISQMIALCHASNHG